MSQRKFRVAGINFAHMHMGDNLRMVHEHPDAEIVALCDHDAKKMSGAAKSFGIPAERLFTNERQAIEASQPDLIILCPPTGEHADWVERVAPLGVHLMVEKPFASNLEEADRMSKAMQASGKQLAINWPLAWYACHRTAKRLVAEGAIGELRGLDYYDGNRGPLYHVEDKRETSEEFRTNEKAASWFYKRESGGGSLLDYLGYGTTLGTWFLDGQEPLEVTAITDHNSASGLEVDEHSITVARYASGLCRFETRWGTFTDPWTHQPQPKCGFVLRGSEGTISSFDYEEHVTLQTQARPEAHTVAVDPLNPPHQNPVQYMLDCLANDRPVEGPISTKISRVGQAIVDAASRSAAEKRTVTYSSAVYSSANS